MAGLPGNALLSKRRTGLPKDSVVNVTQMATVDKDDLLHRSGRLTPSEMEKVDEGLRLVLKV
jgi:mRNA interferase MazF